MKGMKTMIHDKILMPLMHNNCNNRVINKPMSKRIIA